MRGERLGDMFEVDFADTCVEGKNSARVDGGTSGTFMRAHIVSKDPHFHKRNSIHKWVKNMFNT